MGNGYGYAIVGNPGESTPGAGRPRSLGIGKSHRSEKEDHMDDRKISRRTVLAFTGAAAAVPGFSGAAFGAPRKSELTFGFDETSSWGTIGMIAEAEKTFTKAGADVRARTFGTGSETRDAMVAGRVDIGVLGGTPFIFGAAEGDLIAIAMAMYAGGSNSVVAGIKSGLKSVKDLKGRRVASQVGTTTNYVFVNKILPAYGLTQSEIHLVNMPEKDQVAALAAGSVDAFANVEPFPSIAQVDHIGTVLVDYSRFDMMPVVVAARRPIVEREPEAIVAFLRGWLAAVKLFN
ncbi:MAG: ABC transporter substrate-binding protein, partial [Acetobacteraceae bacterium]